jgi:hypothetical protein
MQSPVYEFYAGDTYAHYLRTLSMRELSTEFRVANHMESSIVKTRQLWAIHVEFCNRAQR